jgi:hypothetical protein
MRAMPVSGLPLQLDCRFRPARSFVRAGQLESRFSAKLSDLLCFGLPQLEGGSR